MVAVWPTNCLTDGAQITFPECVAVIFVEATALPFSCVTFISKS